MNRKIYIIGPISGHPRSEVEERFKAAENYLIDQGDKPYNPVALIPQDMDWEDAMRYCITLLTACQAVYVLPGWQNSRGSLLEMNIATALKMELIMVWSGFVTCG